MWVGNGDRKGGGKVTVKRQFSVVAVALFQTGGTPAIKIKIGGIMVIKVFLVWQFGNLS